MNFSSLIVLLLCANVALAGGVETRPTWFADVFIEAMEDSQNPMPTIDFIQPQLFLPIPIETTPFKNIKIQFGDVVIGGAIAEPNDGGVETITKQAHTEVETFKYLGETPSAVYLQINNKYQFLKIQDQEAHKVDGLIEKIGASVVSSDWMSFK